MKYQYRWKKTKEELRGIGLEKTSLTRTKRIMESRRSIKDREVSDQGIIREIFDFLRNLPKANPSQSYIAGSTLLDILFSENSFVNISDSVNKYKNKPTESCILNYLLYHLAPIVWYHEDEPYLPANASRFCDWSRVSWWDGKRERLGEFGWDFDDNITKWIAMNTGNHPVRKSDFSHPAGGQMDGQCFFLKPTWDTSSTTNRPEWDLSDSSSKSKEVKFIPCYIDVEPTSAGLLFRYWFFHCHNEWKWGSFQHQGDWEHIEVYIAAPFNLRELEIIPYAVVYFHHYFPPTHIEYSKCEKEVSHPVVYSGLKSHASYPKGDSEVSRYQHYVGKIVDKTGQGIRWNTCEFKLVPAWVFDWSKFGGAWGSVRKKFGSLTYHSGPSGPLFKSYVEPITRTRINGISFQLWNRIPGRKIKKLGLNNRSDIADIAYLWWVKDPFHDSIFESLELEWYTEFSHEFHKIASTNPFDFLPPDDDEYDDSLCKLAGSKTDDITSNLVQITEEYAIRKESILSPIVRNIKNVRELYPIPLQAWNPSRLDRVNFDATLRYYFRTKLRFKTKPYGTIIAFTDIVPSIFPCKKKDLFGIPLDMNYRYVLNDNEGTIHDIQCGIPWHLSSIRKMQRLVSIPIYSDMKEFDPSKAKPKLSFFKGILERNPKVRGNIDTNISIVESSLLHELLYKKDPLKSAPVSDLKLCQFCF